MNYEEFVNRIVADGIESARRDYKGQAEKERGAVAGFEACRGKNPVDLAILLESARKQTQEKWIAGHNGTNSDEGLREYWYARCYEGEVEWTCNCVSAMLMNQKLPVIISPTARGIMRAAEILGVVEEKT